MSCPTWPDVLYCGSACSAQLTHAATGGDWKENAINCPANYKWWRTGTIAYPVGASPGDYHKYESGSWTAFVRRCVRDVKYNRDECAIGEGTKEQCPTGMCSATSPASVQYMNSQCWGAYIMNDARCTKWSIANKPAFDAVAGTWCNSMRGLEEDPAACKSWCLKNPGKCSIISNEPGNYCALYPESSICGCINSPLNKLTAGGKAAPPATCFDNVCMNNGYKPSPNARGLPGQDPCGDFMDCSQVVNIKDQAIVSRVKITQNCVIEKNLAEAAKKDQIAANAADKYARNRDSTLAKYEAEDTRAEAAIANRKAAYAKEKYKQIVPSWKQTYDDVISEGIAKDVADAINDTVPDFSDIEISEGVELDDIKPLLVLIFLIIVLLFATGTGGTTATPGPSSQQAYNYGPYPVSGAPAYY